MYSARANTALPVLGFPIRESAGQRLFSTSPRLIAAVHALLRLLMPRHPPCALTILTVIVDSRCRLAPSTGYNGDLPLFGQLCSFQGPARAQPGGLPGWSLKTQQCRRGGRAPGSGLGPLRGDRLRTTPPGPVDVSGRPQAMRPADGLCAVRQAAGAARCAAATSMSSLERR